MCQLWVYLLQCFSVKIDDAPCHRERSAKQYKQPCTTIKREYRDAWCLHCDICTEKLSVAEGKMEQMAREKEKVGTGAEPVSESGKKQE